MCRKKVDLRAFKEKHCIAEKEDKKVCKYCEGELVKITEEDSFLDSTSDYVCSICGAYADIKIK